MIDTEIRWIATFLTTHGRELQVGGLTHLFGGGGGVGYEVGSPKFTFMEFMASIRFYKPELTQSLIPQHSSVDYYTI